MRTPREEAHEKSSCAKPGTFGHSLACDGLTATIEKARAEGMAVGIATMNVNLSAERLGIDRDSAWSMYRLAGSTKTATKGGE